MKEAFDYILNIDPNIRVSILITLFYSLEMIMRPANKFSGKFTHMLNNAAFQVLFVLVGFAVSYLQVGVFNWGIENKIGLFHFAETPFWLQAIIGIMALDLTSYWVHRIAHKTPTLWTLHRVHHSDNRMDTSSWFRGHPIEAFVFGAGNVVAVLVFGLDLTIISIYFLIILPFGISQHSNFVVPTWVDNTFGKIFITPNFHKMHHSRDQHYTDSNFADIFVFWDKLFGTFTYAPVSEIKFGLKEFEDEKKQTIWYLLKSPFISIPRVKD